MNEVLQFNGQKVYYEIETAPWVVEVRGEAEKTEEEKEEQAATALSEHPRGNLKGGVGTPIQCSKAEG